MLLYSLWISIKEKQPITNKLHKTKLSGTFELEENFPTDCLVIKLQSKS